MNNSMTETYLPKFLTLFFSSMLIAWVGTNMAVAAEPANTLKQVRTVDTDDLFNEEFFSAGNPGFPGVGFPPGANTLLTLDPSGGANLVLVAPPKKGQGKNGKVARLPIEISDPINIAFDSVAQGARGANTTRMILLDAAANELIAVKAGARNVMNSGKIKRLDVKAWGIDDPQGMTLDPAANQLLVLDGAGLSLVSIQLKPGREFGGAEVTSIDLPGNLGEPRGLAFNPEDGHLYVLSAKQKKLHKLTKKGELVTSLDLAGLDIDTPQGMVFAPSLDLTDHPSICHLYLVAAKGEKGRVTEWALPGSF